MCKYDCHVFNYVLFRFLTVFQDPVDFDFLQNCGNNGLAGRDFGKESLFVKFDPLVSRLPPGARYNRDSGAQLKTETHINPHKADGKLHSIIIIVYEVPLCK